MINRGYVGYSMSVRAAEAYECGEKPLSKWTKQDIISAVADIAPGKAELLKKVNLATLKDKVLYRSSWHHTSSQFNKTDFYSVDEDYIEHLTEADIFELMGKTEMPETTTNCYRGDVHYLEWTGTRSHPKATECYLRNVNIEERGCFYYITDDTGRPLLKKKIGSNGTWVTRAN